ncbi:MAG: ribosome assembly RNA-binding protein YhbY [Gammaproteobacteria bacterium]|uniref:ribosome assembly RNA-binding protein YhbY n=1 Tax=Methyloprofundus sp. TaxID=2020875 RepID=UPI0017B6250A|nr:ribosome assembly RNA-binding protein YhbY [Methyloprofundus sp.]MBT3812821.1 ribosome assembly RNA-binding protein YhbY [Gammaproteobacteria bacterium]HIL79133.1 ribosome assembly RNA-binding protein YhbY [Methylococcales bacterium]MBT4145543.1 ribosome assembly RNA-binding protein YhbY [Gammaproteobacteria bacterium]MBT5222683.1 ribosome assembly RNA-binding protein YhbY [Gammaproteobacteria bacterium]MBT5826331.1 ribosome assembly RNA-binding protein YhbY [Gammaproteobacteria bacterium]
MNSDQLKQMKTKAHELKPVIMIGQAGLTDAVLKEIELALDIHELIKIKIRAEREERKLIQQHICTKTSAELIQSIGQVVVIYRKKPEQAKKKPAPHTRRRDGTR